MAPIDEHSIVIMGGNGVGKGDLSDVWLLNTQNESLELVAEGPLTHCTWGNPCA